MCIRDSLYKGVILLHARPHTAQLICETVNKLPWETLPHPPNSPDFAPSDFHLLGPLKEVLRGTKLL